ncbi:hypothetical protein FOCC_FOCC013696 [Frankliniella occidentalis]|uniref:Fidgetin-like protein 1 n=1 Tax=Frankliniella occidentalis TaxID=133901 RepID=A0A6J1TDG6_FRAOC|nr:fidgetin-like protein 1 [Frankliniella occidentalis]XP_052129026.1 fidgetin-like protein 1 [Frankliniella occidentalis]KAE8740797.1 hypothetical protein FOCC_FOCC013696 [Frankliniella occidentalis]
MSYRRFEGPPPAPRGRGEFFGPPAPRLRMPMPYPGMYHPPLQYHPHQLPARPSFHHHFSNTFRHPSSTNTLSSPHFAPRAHLSPSSFRSPHHLPLSTSSTSCSSPSSLPVASISSSSSTAASSVSCTTLEPISPQVVLPAQSSSSTVTSSVSSTLIEPVSITTTSIPSISLTSSNIPIFTQSMSSSCAAPSSSPTPPALPSSDDSNIKQRLRSSANTPIMTSAISISSESDEEGGPADKKNEQNVRKRKSTNQISKRKSKNATNWREETIIKPKCTPTQPKVPPAASKITNLSNSSLSFERVMHNNSGLDEKMVKKVLSLIQVSRNVHWDDVCGLSSVKQRLKEMVVYPLLNPALFQGLRSPGRGLLLFGPPGNGKTLIGKCLASEARATFFSVTASSFGSKWYGEAETLAKTLFESARALQPSIIFIDEVDSILRSAQENDGGCSTRLRTELLACMDGCTTSGKDEVLVVGATNWPGKIDEAARRRFTRRLYVPLPDKETRTEQFQRELRNEKHDINEEQFQIMADMTEGYSGADISQVCRNAAMKPIRSLDLNGLSIEFVEMEDVRPINLDDFLESINETSKSVSAEMIKQLETFNEKYGSL